MLVYRYAENPYKVSRVNTHANTVNATGNGVFCFDPARPVIRMFDNKEYIEDMNADFLMGQFGEIAFGGQLNMLDVDNCEIVSRGYGRYANLQSNNCNDYVYVPEVYVEFV